MFRRPKEPHREIRQFGSGRHDSGVLRAKVAGHTERRILVACYATDPSRSDSRL